MLKHEIKKKINYTKGLKYIYIKRITIEIETQNKFYL
jgi:hypothetical protein